MNNVYIYIYRLWLFVLREHSLGVYLYLCSFQRVLYDELLSTIFLLFIFLLSLSPAVLLSHLTNVSLPPHFFARQMCQIVTLMSTDAQRFPDACLSIHSLWSTPIFVIVAIFLLIRLVGGASVAGVVFLIIMIPVQGSLATRQMGMKRQQMKQTDSRVKVINEVLQVSDSCEGTGWSWDARF